MPEFQVMTGRYIFIDQRHVPVSRVSGELALYPDNISLEYLRKNAIKIPQNPDQYNPKWLYKIILLTQEQNMQCVLFDLDTNKVYKAIKDGKGHWKHLHVLGGEAQDRLVLALS